MITRSKSQKLKNDEQLILIVTFRKTLVNSYLKDLWRDGDLKEIAAISGDMAIKKPHLFIEGVNMLQEQPEVFMKIHKFMGGSPWDSFENDEKQ